MAEKKLSKNPKDSREFVERRRKPDWVVRSVTIIAVIGWICAFAALILMNRARPLTDDFFSKILNTPAVGSWDSAMLRVAFIAVLVSFFTCVIGLFVNMARHRRKTDRYNKSIIILGVISFIAIIVFIISLF